MEQIVVGMCMGNDMYVAGKSLLWNRQTRLWPRVLRVFWEVLWKGSCCFCDHWDDRDGVGMGEVRTFK